MNAGELTHLLELGDRIVAMATKRVPGVVAECVVRSGAELSAKVRKGEPELVEEAGTRSAGLRVIHEQRVAMTSTSDLSDAGLERFVADALELAQLSQPDPFAGPPDPKLLADPSLEDVLDLYDPKAGTIPAKEAVMRAMEAEKAALDYDPRITNSDGASFDRVTGGSAYVFSSGFRAAQRGSYASLSVVPIAPDAGGKNRRGSYWTAARHVEDLESGVFVGQQAARETLAKLGAKSVATCEVPVIFDPDSARAMLGALAGCIMGGAIWRKASYLIGREGTRVASPLVTIVDDPLIRRGPASRMFDGEGLVSRRNVVVEKGILKTYLCDSYSARKLGRESTASASRGAGAGVGGSTSNFFIEAGIDSPAAILKGTPRGLFVTDMMGFGFNSVTGDFSRGAAGFWIENGELAFPVSEVTISLNIDDLWQRIDAVGSDLRMRASTESPTLRVAKMTVAGGG